MLQGFYGGYMRGVVCPTDVLMCMVLDAGWEKGGMMVYDHRSCILPGASSSHVKYVLNYLFCVLNDLLDVLTVLPRCPRCSPPGWSLSGRRWLSGPPRPAAVLSSPYPCSPDKSI
jgi:hypothetical protein